MNESTASAMALWAWSRFTVEVTITGPVDPDTGMIADLGELDPFVQREVIEAFDYKYLNEDIPGFQDRGADNRKCLS